MSTVLAIVALFGAVTLNTEWQDVPDATKVGEVLNLGNGPAVITNASEAVVRSYDATNLTGRINAKYVKPVGGIPMEDLASGVYNTIFAKQDHLVSSVNIKTINGSSVLGSGNLIVEGADARVYDVQTNGISVLNNKIANIDLSRFVGKSVTNGLASVGYVDEAVSHAAPPDYTTTNAVREIVAPMTNAAVAAAVGCATNAAKAYADGTFLKTSGGTVSNGFYVAYDSNYYPYKSALINPSVIAVWKDINHDTLPDAAFNLPSDTEYGGDILTDEYAKHIFPIVTNAYTKTEVDNTFVKSNGVGVLETIIIPFPEKTPYRIHHGPEDTLAFFKEIDGETKVAYFCADNSRLLSENSVKDIFPIVTNAYTKGEVDSTFAPLTMIAATDTTFSNATVAVVNDMATRSITASVDAALTDILGADWKTTYGGGLAGIIAALVGALAWLKANKVGSFSAVGGVTPTVSGGVADVSSLFSGANTSLVAVCQQYGGTQIKRDEQGNYYYDVED